MASSVVFTKYVPEDEAKGRPHTLDICICEGAAGVVRNLTRSDRYEYDPAFSSDGKQIAFAAVTDVARHETNIFVMNRDGSGARQVTRHTAQWLVGAPSFSPDSRQIVYHLLRREPKKEQSLSPAVYVVDVLSRVSRKIKAGGIAVWSPDGKEILFHSQEQGTGLYDVRRRTARPFFSDERRAKRYSSEVWSPDGKMVAAIVDLGEEKPDALSSPVRLSGVALLDRNGKEIRSLLHGADRYKDKFGLQWGADNKEIFYTAETA